MLGHEMETYCNKMYYGKYAAECDCLLQRLDLKRRSIHKSIIVYSKCFCEPVTWGFEMQDTVFVKPKKLCSLSSEVKQHTYLRALCKYLLHL